jgi:type IV secretion system protein TrbJ
VAQIDQTFERYYPQSYSVSTSSQQLVSDAQTRWQNSLAAYQDALRVQAGVVQALDTTRTQTDGLVSSSQSAVGMLQAAQAGNQLVALQTRQLADLTAVIAAQGRAQSLEGARLTANQEQAQVQINQFLTNGQGYQAQTVQMFH